MDTIAITAIIFGAILISSGFLMLYKNYKPILGFFVMLAGVVIIIGALFDPQSLLPRQILHQIGINL